MQAEIQAYPVPHSVPMFSYMAKGKLVVVSQSQLRSVLAGLLTATGLNAKEFVFHTFCFSGASLAFGLNIPMQYIKAHGTWDSDAAYNYIDYVCYPIVLTQNQSHFSRHYPIILDFGQCI